MLSLAQTARRLTLAAVAVTTLAIPEHRDPPMDALLDWVPSLPGRSAQPKPHTMVPQPRDGRTGYHFETNGTFVTPNFRVWSPNPALSETVGRRAEFEFARISKRLGGDAPILAGQNRTIVLINERPGVETSRTFFDPNTSPRDFRIYLLLGNNERILEDDLPHEMAHVVLNLSHGKLRARCFEEGLAMCQESARNRLNYNILGRQLLNDGKGVVLAHLFNFSEYEHGKDPIFLQGYSLCDFLIREHGGYPKLLQFVAMGEGEGGWEAAAMAVYGFPTTRHMQDAWITSLKAPFVRPRDEDE